jgi:hypothetical protein
VSKGSKRRPQHVSEPELEERWARTFGFASAADMHRMEREFLDDLERGVIKWSEDSDPGSWEASHAVVHRA